MVVAYSLIMDLIVLANSLLADQLWEVINCTD